MQNQRAVKDADEAEPPKDSRWSKDSELAKGPERAELMLSTIEPVKSNEVPFQVTRGIKWKTRTQVLQQDPTMPTAENVGVNVLASTKKVLGVGDGTDSDTTASKDKEDKEVSDERPQPQDSASAWNSLRDAAQAEEAPWKGTATING